MSTICLPKFSKDKAGILLLGRWGGTGRGWSGCRKLPGQSLCLTVLRAPAYLAWCSADAQCVARAAQMASRIPSLAIHAPHSGPCVRLWVVDLHSAQPQLAVISPDGIEKPVHHGHTNAAAGCCHRMALLPAIGDGVEHFHHVQGITCIKICYSN